MTRCYLLALALFLTACATAGGREYSAGAAQANESVVHVYRPWAFASSGYTALLQLDALEPRSLQNAGYISFRVSPGRHTLRTVKKGFQDWGGKVQEITFDTLGGQVYFIKYDVQGSAIATGGTMPVVMTSSLNMYMVPAYRAEPEMSELRESE